MAKQQKKQYYIVVNEQGARLFRTWDKAKPYCIGQKGVKYKGFAGAGDALVWLEQFPNKQTAAVRAELVPLAGKEPAVSVTNSVKADPSISMQTEIPSADTVLMYSDGGSLGNPGPGGYGVVIRYNGHVKELSGGFAVTTNNRMELLGCITGLESLKRSCKVALYTDSSYVVNGIEKGWAVKWQRQGWTRNKAGDPAKNADLWSRLLDAVERHDVKFTWVKGHAGNAGNERCDELAKLAARQDNLPDDPGYPG